MVEAARLDRFPISIVLTAAKSQQLELNIIFSSEHSCRRSFVIAPTYMYVYCRTCPYLPPKGPESLYPDYPT